MWVKVPSPSADMLSHSLPGVIGLLLSTGEREPELVQSVLGIRLVVPEAIIGFAPAVPAAA